MHDEFADELAQVLRQRAEAAPTRVEAPEALVERVTRARRRRLARIGALGAALLVFSVGAVGATIGGSGGSDRVSVSSPPRLATPTPETTDAPASPTTRPTAPPTTVLPSPPATTAPELPSPPVEASSTTALVALDEGRVVELRDDGTVVRELLRFDPAKGAILDLEVGRDGHLYYLQESASAVRCGRVLRTPLAGGLSQVVAEAATAFAVGPNGTIAFGLDEDCGGTGTTAHGVVEIWRSGQVLRWTTGEFGGPGVLANHPGVAESLEWSPDGSRLAASLCFEGCVLVVLDAFDEGNAWIDSERSWVGRAPAWTGAGLWFPQHSSSYHYYDEGGANPPPADAMRHLQVGAADPETRSYPFDGVVNALAADDGIFWAVVGEHFGSRRGALYAWDGDGDPELVRVDVTAVAVSHVV